MSFKKRGYDSSYLFSQTPSSIFLATVEALEHHYQFELIEDLLMASIVQMKSGDQGIFLGELKNVSEYRLVPILVSLVSNFPKHKDRVEYFLNLLGKDKLTALKYQKALFNNENNSFLAIGAQWSIDHKLDLISLINSYISKKTCALDQNNLALIYKRLNNEYHSDVELNPGKKCKLFRAICVLFFCGLELDLSQIMQITNPFISNSSSQLKQYQTCLFILSIPIATPNNWIMIRNRLKELFSIKTEGFSQTLAVYLFSNDVIKFQSSISSLMNCSISLSSERYQMIRNLNMELFSDAAITEMCLNLLDAPSLPLITLSLLHHLLKFNVVSFTGDSLSFGMKKLFAKTREVNELLIEIIEYYVQKIFSSNNQVAGIQLDNIKQKVNLINTEGALLLYYLLLYRERAQIRFEVGEGFHIKRIASFVKENHPVLYPCIISVIAKQLPYLFDVSIVISEWGRCDSDIRSSSSKVFHIVCALKNNDQISTSQFNVISSWWIQCHSENPILACIQLIQALSKESFEANDFPEQVMNPTLLIELLSPLFNQQLITIFIQVLQFSSNYFKANLPQECSFKEKERIILLYYSLLVQKLLHLCNQYSGPEYTLKCAFDFIHQLFIEHAALTRLIHFQTYSLGLIPETVKYIPSIHVCIELIPDLLLSSDISKVEFGLVLGAALCRQYPIKSTRQLADRILKTLRNSNCSQDVVQSVKKSLKVFKDITF